MKSEVIRASAAGAIRDCAPAARVVALSIYLCALALAVSALILYIDVPRSMGTARSAVMGFEGLTLVLVAAMCAIPGRRIERLADRARDITAGEDPLHDLLSRQVTIWSFAAIVLIAGTALLTIHVGLEIIGDLP